jgi:hypothetical protein
MNRNSRSDFPTVASEEFLGQRDDDARRPSDVAPSAVKKTIAASKSSTTTLTWSNLLIVMSLL